MEQALIFIGILSATFAFMTVSLKRNKYDWCRSLAISFLIDGYCFRPYNQDAMNTGKYEITHMSEWDPAVFVKIYESIS